MTCSLCGDYYIPNIKHSNTDPIEWNHFPCMARAILYNNLFLSEQLSSYLKENGEIAAAVWSSFKLSY